MDQGVDADAYEALVTAAETYRAALVVRLGGEAGLRTGEITRVAPRHLRETEGDADLSILAVPSEDTAGGGETDGAPETEPAPRDRSGIDRETAIPASLAAEMRRYAESADLGESEPFVDVSPRRVQMIVSETAERAAARSDGLVGPDVTPRDLRRTFARRLLADRGVDPHAVREAGGWETMATLDGYLGPLDGEAIASAIAGGRGGSADGPADESAPTALGGFEALADGDDRATPLAAVPDGVTESDRWAEAWVVRGTGDRGRVEIAGAAGVDRETLVDRGVDGDGPWREAVEEEEAISTAGSPATAGRPAVAVPLRYRDVTHGALCVVAGGESSSETVPSVSSVERREIAALGRCLGWAVTAERWRELLHSDAVTEVEFHTGDEGAFLARASATLGCRIELASTVAVDDDASRFYLSVEGARPQALADAVAGASGVSDLRVIETREDGCDVSARVAGGSAVRTLTEHGATVRDATAEDGRVRVVADLPEGADVRPVAEGFRDAFDDARLASKESVARAPRSEDSLREGVADRFTDRQWAALSAAYHGGYFDWPRGSTAEEVADAMDVSSPTFHNHLRKAQRRLLDELFEDGRRARRLDQG
ncbi:bacterio-opsin activator domain-containing protein [Halorubrum lipolyticum]|uniref:Bacterio-opsin activator HTH domain protein n=1 Tax=Halorubrum lipolyticum DSM 21995 TaxID=1227482 RepID=M0P262_9EURY|nr:bacterio-opsin activator domain-containing protein [Halorubrum lipolyticum]EMA63928.1 Bacterio-opsin activator HTH domain protein [Halorubrum lipolyticum DSM 21995]